MSRWHLWPAESEHWGDVAQGGRNREQQKKQEVRVMALMGPPWDSRAAFTMTSRTQTNSSPGNIHGKGGLSMQKHCKSNAPSKLATGE